MPMHTHPTWSSNFSYLSKHCAGVRPTMGAMVRHWQGISLARCSSFSSSSRVHSVFLMDGSSHSYLHGRSRWGLRSSEVT